METAFRNTNKYFYYAFCILGVFFCIELLNTFYVKNGLPASKISTLIRIIFEAIFISCFFIRRFIDRTTLKLFLIFAIVLVCSTVGNIIIDTSAINLTTWGNHFSSKSSGLLSNMSFLYVNQCLFIFLYFYFYKLLFKKLSPMNKKSLFHLYEFIILFYGFTAIIGFLFDIEICRTYAGIPGYYRWGYNGLLPYTNASSGFWLIALFYSLFVFFKEKRKFLLAISLMATILAGSKALWLLTGSIVFIFFMKFYSNRNKIAILILSIIFFTLFSASVPYLLPILRDKIDIVNDIAFAVEHKDDIIKVLSSGRLNFNDSGGGRIFEALSYLDYLSYFNYLFGGLGGIVIMELSFIDIPFAFGILGTILFIKGYFLLFQNIESSFKNYFILFYFVTALLIGWLFNTPSLAPYLTIFILKTESNLKTEGLCKIQNS